MDSCDFNQDKNKKLTDMAVNCGCSAKLAQGLLSDILDQFPAPVDPNLMVGFHTRDDACVYRLDEQTAVIQTLDFFTPIVDDPYLFGQIAAANALSDIFAMGADPKLALNILCIPHDMDKQTVSEILSGGYAKVSEAGAMLAGGHTIEDPIPKYGLSVTGFAHPDRILRNSAAMPGDALILTKPLGTGILTTAKKLGVADPAAYGEMTSSMAFLNKKAKDIMLRFSVHACTDVTGFGFLGHLLEMAEGSGLSAHITSDMIPVFPTVLAHAKAGEVGGAVYRNLNALACHISYQAHIGNAMKYLMSDPQTSGGLLIAVAQDDAHKMLAALQSELPHPAIIGYFTEKKESFIQIY